MNTQPAVYTEKAECQDCYKCLRICSVKAIRIENGRASVIEDRCISCGSCINVCPAEAKRTRDDTFPVKEALKNNKRVTVSLAPSYLAEFDEWEISSLISAIKNLGFFGVSETALGAERVSEEAAELTRKNPEKNYISSACPAVVEYISRYAPKLIDSLTPIASPLRAHCRMLREEFGEDTLIVFFGPCAAKKVEASSGEEGLLASLTFKDLRRWFKEEGIDPGSIKPESSPLFIPERAARGSLYPFEGGMLTGIKSGCGTSDKKSMSFSGLDTLISVIDELESSTSDRGLFLELLACAGGCVNGPLMNKPSSLLGGRLRVMDKTEEFREGSISKASDISASFTLLPVSEKKYSEEEVREVLNKSGKLRKEDELNCGGCGYNSCREFAYAVIEENAETEMCVTYMRKLAQKKANKLIMSIPSAVLIAGKDMKIIECNRNFAKISGPEIEEIYESNGNLTGALLDKVLPISNLISHVLKSSEEIKNKDIRINNRIYSVSVFLIEEGEIAGCILNDITEPSIKKEEIIKRARNVVRNNLETVQKIACLLGENAAETEISLSSIIDSYREEESDKG